MSIGAQLRASREARGLSIEALARTTRVQARILAAIERDDVAAVPPPPFGRGLVRAYAQEMGLDADRTARDYFAQFAAPRAPAGDLEIATEPAAGRSGLWVASVATVGVVAGIALAIVAGRAVRPAPSRPEPGAAGPPATSTAPAPAAMPGPPPAPVPTPADPPPAALPAPLIIVLTANKPVWISADTDGRRALYRTLTPGTPVTLQAKEEIVIRVGDAGALAWTVNGRAAGAMGRPGQVRDLRITPSTAATIR